METPSRGIPLKKKRYLLRDSDRSGFTHRNVELVYDNGSLVSGDEYDNPPPSNRLKPDEGGVSPGDTRSNYTDYSQQTATTVQYVTESSQITLNRQTDNAGTYDYNKSIVYVAASSISYSPNTVMILPFDTAFNDLMGRHTISTSGTVSIDTSQSVFGGASIKFDGSSGYLTTPDHSDFDFSGGIWTIDCRVYVSDVTTFQMIYGQANGANDRFIIYISLGKLWVDFIVGGVQKADVRSRASAISINTWTHLAFVENGDSWYIFVNGSNVVASGGTCTDRLPNYAVGSPVYIGARQYSSPGYFNGYIDEFRISKGIARWTSNFTPPTSAYGRGDADCYPLQIVGTQVTPSVSGDFLTIQGVGSSVILNNGSGLRLYTNSIRIDSGTQLNLIFDSGNNLWCETSRQQQLYSLTGAF